MRTISEILIAADSTDSLNELEALDKEIVINKYKYPLVEIKFAQEHLKTRYLHLVEEIQFIIKGYK